MDENLNISGLAFNDEDSLNAYIKGFKKKSIIDYTSKDYVSTQIPLAEIRPRGSDYHFKSNKRGFMNECMDIKVRFIFGSSRNNLIDIHTFHHSHWKNEKATKLGLALFDYIYSRLDAEERKIVDMEKTREYYKRHSQNMQAVADEQRRKQEKRDNAKRVIGGGIKAIGKGVSSVGKGVLDAAKDIMKVVPPTNESSSTEPKFETYSGPADKIHPSYVDWSSNKAIYYDDDGNEYTLEGDLYVKK